MAPLALLVSACVLAACGSSTPSTTTKPTTTSTASTTTIPPTSTTTTSTTVPSAFYSSVRSLDAVTRARMIGRSWHTGCPVGLDQLRLVTVSYLGFDGRTRLGHLIVNVDATSAVVAAMRSIYGARFPIRSMIPVDSFGGDDERSMAADNTSAFNCRIVPGSTVWSQHAYGRAVDVNPLENPEVQDGTVDPPSAWPYVNRSQDRLGMIHQGDAAWLAFHGVGWYWGGEWSSLKDYQHFSRNGY